MYSKKKKKVKRKEKLPYNIIMRLALTLVSPHSIILFLSQNRYNAYNVINLSHQLHPLSKLSLVSHLKRPLLKLSLVFHLQS